ncbi:hypothetical protein BGY98DRAFT_598864 [Russula aff. rugulosa BPL654]|nr:hypothetical protein BGY98DRAFT_598864 [Russula aff. rugulosa BPL654]
MSGDSGQRPPEGRCSGDTPSQTRRWPCCDTWGGMRTPLRAVVPGQQCLGFRGVASCGSPFLTMDIRVSILMQVIEVDLCRSGIVGACVGVNSPKLGQEYVENLPAEGKARGWSTFSPRTAFASIVRLASGASCRRPFHILLLSCSSGSRPVSALSFGKKRL